MKRSHILGDVEGEWRTFLARAMPMCLTWARSGFTILTNSNNPQSRGLTNFHFHRDPRSWFGGVEWDWYVRCPSCMRGHWDSRCQACWRSRPPWITSGSDYVKSWWIHRCHGFATGWCEENVLVSHFHFHIFHIFHYCSFGEKLGIRIYCMSSSWVHKPSRTFEVEAMVMIDLDASKVRTGWSPNAGGPTYQILNHLNPCVLCDIKCVKCKIRPIFKL